MIVVDTNIISYFYISGARSSQAEQLLIDNEFEIPSAHIMQLVSSSNCSAYDCDFIALAQYLNAPLITADKKVLREFPNIAKSLDSYFA